MLKYSNGQHAKWADIEGKFVLLIRGYEGGGPPTKWSIARVDDYSDMAESITSKFYYTFGENVASDNFVNAARLEECGGLIHKIFADFDQAKAAKTDLIAFTTNIVAQQKELLDKMQAELDAVASL